MKLRRSILVLSYVVASTQQQLPSCAQTCKNRTPTTCGSGDTFCRCSSPQFVSDLSCCIVVNCGPIDQEAAATRLSSQCLSVGVTVPSTAICASTSSLRTSISATLVQSVTSTPPASSTSSVQVTASSATASPTSSGSSSSASNHSPTGASTAASTPTPSPSSPSSPPGLSAGAIAGTAVGSLVGIAILTLALVLFRTRRSGAKWKPGDSYPSSHSPEFGDAVLEPDLTQTPQHFAAAPAPIHQPAIAELPTSPPRHEVDGFSHPLAARTRPASSVPTTATSELPSDGGSPVGNTFDSDTLSPISPVSPRSDLRNRE